MPKFFCLVLILRVYLLFSLDCYALILESEQNRSNFNQKKKIPYFPCPPITEPSVKTQITVLSHPATISQKKKKNLCRVSHQTTVTHLPENQVVQQPKPSCHHHQKTLKSFKFKFKK